MVAETLRTASKAEKELKRLTNDGHQDSSAQAAKELRQITEKAVFTAVSVAENWGKAALDKTREITEEITQ